MLILLADRTPELTNTGSFEKCWRLEDGEWRNEPAGDCIKSQDFTKNAKVDFEPAIGIIGDESDYIKIYEALRKVDKNIAEQYVQMCYLDGLIYNIDRHENNFGVLRDNDTGEIVSLAPFYDHNISLIVRDYPNRTPQDRLISDFAELAHRIGSPIHVRKLDKQELLQAAHNIPYFPRATDTVPDPAEFVARYLISRQTALCVQCRDLLQFTEDKPSVLCQIQAAQKGQRECSTPPYKKTKSQNKPEL